VRLQFKGKTPVWAQILTSAIVVEMFLQIAATYWIPRWAPLQPDVTHSYQIRFRGGPVYFVQPWLGAYSDYGLYAGFALVGLFFLLLWLNRDKVERVS
jgi:hypothetical protein